MVLAEFGSRGAVDVLLSKMFKVGEVERSGRGYYKLPNSKPAEPGKIGEKGRLATDDVVLIVEKSNLTDLTNLTGELSAGSRTDGSGQK
jgi:hypothetical protein